MSIYQRQRNPFLSSRPYVYAISWSNLNCAYVGLRYARGCCPDDLWTTYFTSSEYVAAFREKYGEPDSIEIIEEFLTAEEAIAAEHEIISTFDLHHSPVFLNKSCGKCYVVDEDVLAKRSRSLRGKTPHNKGKKLGSPSEAARAKMREKATGRLHSEAARQRMSELKKAYWANKRSD